MKTWKASRLAAPLLLAGIVSVAAIPHEASVKERHGTWIVGNNGLDSDSCGSSETPCRSITQAIANASPGDLIVVGPGRYGDVDNDGDLDDPGDEHGPNSCFCMLNVDKRLTIISRDGAASTVIDGGNINLERAVDLSIGRTVFGGEDHGFSIVATAMLTGIRLEFGDAIAVEGNSVALNEHANGIFSVSGRDHRIRGNIAARNGNGITVISNSTRVDGNVAYDNSLRGFYIAGTQHTVVGNVSRTNGVGFLVQGSDHLIRRNAAVANGTAGVIVSASLLPGDTHDNLITENNIYGNGQLSPGVSNCGVEKQTLGVDVLAPHNFFGASSGPGPDPADAACNLDTDGSRLIVVPFATEEFHISGKMHEE